jgi:peptide/nickel transport system permease protein
MGRYLARRSVEAAVTLLVFLTAVFLLIHAQPGDFTTFYVLDADMPPEVRERIAHSFGLDQPLWRQYLTYLGNLLRGDLGVSFEHYPRTVASVLAERLPRTLLLFLTATVVSFYFGFWLGKATAWRRGGLVETAATVSGVFLYTAFTPWLVLMLLWLFALELDWFPVGKFITPELWTDAPADANAVFVWLLLSLAAVGACGLAAFATARRRGARRPSRWAWAGAAVVVAALAIAWAASGLSPWALDILRHLALPVLALSLVSFGGVMLLTRGSMVSVMREDYVLAARVRGLPDKVVRDRYVARTALLPVATSFIFSLAVAIDGGVVIESVFAWPGMGQTLLSASLAQDLPLAVGAFLLTGAFALVAHLVADILYVFLDPRVRYGR